MICSTVAALQEPDAGSALAAAAQLITVGRSYWRITMRLLLEAWALQMHLLHGVGNDTIGLEAIMERLGITYRQCKLTRQRDADSDDGASSLSSAEHRRGKDKFKKSHKKRSKSKHKRKRAASLDVEELLPLDHTSMHDPQAAEWELDGLLGASGRVTCKYPEVVDVLVAHTLTSWSRQLERR